MKKLNTSHESLFLPLQIGVGIRSGCEGAIHSTRQYAHQDHRVPKIILKLDFENAFNTVRRDLMLKTLKDTEPRLYPLIWQTYHDDTNLYYGHEIIKSATGFQQGDPLASYLFALTIHSLMKQLKSELRIFYLDDGTLGGEIETVLKYLLMIKEQGIKLGLNLNFKKCELHFLTEDINKIEVLRKFNEVAANIKVVEKHELNLLGAPIFNDAYDSVLDKKIEELNTMLERLKTIDAHDAYVILKNALLIPKLTFTIRSTPIYDSPKLQHFDKLVKNSAKHY